MEDNFMALRKTYSNLYSKITNELFKESLNQFSLNLIKKKILII